MPAPFIHSHALCETSEIGQDSRVWAFAYILAGARIGRDANICSHVFIEGGVTIGDRVTIKSGVQLWDGVEVADDVFIGPNVTFTNDLFPRSKVVPEEFAKTRVERGASIGANATILAGTTIGTGAMVGAGAVVTRSVPPNTVVVGNPARIHGYVDSDTAKDDTHRVVSDAALPSEASGDVQVRASAVAGVSVHRLTFQRDLRGSLVAGEFGDEVPFTPQRAFLVFDVPGAEIRGEHAHRNCHQFLQCVRGSVSVAVDDGKTREEILLDHPRLALHIPPWIWATQFKHSPDATLLVLASHHYDPSDYIRDYKRFLEEAANR